MAPDLIFHSLFPGLPAGIAGGKASHQFLVSIFPDTKTVTDDLIAEGDKVLEHWGEFNDLTVIQQLGLMPAPG